jgi:hypothetical protein
MGCGFRKLTQVYEICLGFLDFFFKLVFFSVLSFNIYLIGDFALIFFLFSFYMIFYYFLKMTRVIFSLFFVVLC